MEKEIKEIKETSIEGKIINILSIQQGITNQGIHYTGKKDVALNMILELISQSLSQQKEEMERKIKDLLKKNTEKYQQYAYFHGFTPLGAYELAFEDILTLIKNQ